MKRRVILKNLMLSVSSIGFSLTAPSKLFAKSSEPSAPSAPSAASAPSAPSEPSAPSAPSSPSAPSTPSTASSPSGPDGFLDGEDALNEDLQQKLVNEVENELESDGLEPVNNQNLQDVLRAFQ
jgi:hypothetical protein